MIKQNTYLTVGPSELYFTVGDHMNMALRNNIPSISHRSKEFQEVFSFTVEQLRTLLQVPNDFHIVFTNSATEIWERLIQNCIIQQSFHFVNGSFSNRFYTAALDMGKHAEKYEVDFGKGFDISEVEIPQETELIAITQNETSAGVQFPLEDIAQIRKSNPDAIIAVDAVSSVPFPEFDYEQFDSIYFSVQKGMGLPAGLGVWIFNQKCIEKAEKMQQRGVPIGTYHTIPSLLKYAAKNQTPCTPNVLGIYLLGQVSEDMLRRSTQVIRQETNTKAATLYAVLDNHPYLAPFVQERAHRSKTVIVADITNGKSADELVDYLRQKGLIVGKGYGKHKESQIRIANFPTHSKETFYLLADALEAWT